MPPRAATLPRPCESADARPVPAGKAITKVADRLERAGVIERRWDHANRRKVFVASTSRHEAETTCVFAQLGLASPRCRLMHSVRGDGEHRNTGGRPLAVT